MSKVSEFINTLAVSLLMAAAIINVFEDNMLVALGFANLAILVSIGQAIREMKDSNE